MKHAPLYRQAADLIRKEFIDGKPPGARLPSMSALESMLGVSLMTIRTALRELEAEHLVEQRPGSGTYVAERFPPSKHAAILLDVDIGSENISPGYLKWLRLLLNTFQKEGIAHRPYLGSVPYGTMPPPEISCQELLDDVRLDRINAMIGIYVSHKPDWRIPFRKLGIPALDITYNIDLTTETCIRSIFAHFQRQNRKRVALICWEHPLDDPGLFSSHFFRLAPEYGLTCEESLADTTAAGWQSGMGWERFRDIWCTRSERPDALLLVGGSLWADCQKAIEELGISVPGDLSVAVQGWDEQTSGEVRFPIYTWRVDDESAALSYARAIRALMEGKPLPETTRIDFHEQILEPDLEDLEALPEAAMETRTA